MEDWYRDIQYYNSGHRSSSVSSTGSSHGQNGEVYEGKSILYAVDNY